MSMECIDFSIVKINRNKVFKCEKDCFKRKNCDVKPKFSMNPSLSELTATEVIVDIHNKTDSIIETYAKEWYCVDTKSYAWQSQEICQWLWKGRCLHFSYRLELPPNCKVRVYLYFPEVDDDVVAVLYLTKNCTLEVCNNKSNARRNDGLLKISKSDTRVKHCVDKLNELERLYARRVYALTSDVRENVGLSICSKQMEIKQIMDELPLSIREVVNKWWEKIETEGEINLRTARDFLNLSKADSISHLLLLSPRDFEEWTGDLFRALGYEVKLTPYSGDGGVDVICVKDSVTIGIQCKRWNGIVPDDVIYDLHKALNAYGITEGCVITTGFFAVTAINAAKECGIKLYDRTNLADLIKNALK